MTLRTWSNDLCFHHDMIMSGSLDLNTLDQVTNEDPLAGLDPTKPLFVHPATGNISLRHSGPSTMPMSLGKEHPHRLPQPRPPAYILPLPWTHPQMDRTSPPPKDPRGRRVTSQRSQGTARKTFYEQVRQSRHQEDVAKPGKQIRQGQGGGWRR